MMDVSNYQRVLRKSNLVVDLVQRVEKDNSSVSKGPFVL